MNRHFLFAAATSLAFALGCGPKAQGGGTTGAADDPPSAGGGGSSALGAFADSTSAGGSGGVTTGSPDPTEDAAPPCDVCSSALGGVVSSPLCAPSQTAYDSFVACACAGVCASVCGNDAAGTCLDGWDGNPPIECKTCLVSATGCGPSLGACKVTLSDQAPCSMDYECCSGVCTAGKCDGGCGIIFSF